jgi:hypothetical protein
MIGFISGQLSGKHRAATRMMYQMRMARVCKPLRFRLAVGDIARGTEAVQDQVGI